MNKIFLIVYLFIPLLLFTSLSFLLSFLVLGFDILSHPILINDLNLLEFLSIDFISPLPYPILDRLCQNILSKMHSRIQWLNLESLCVLFAASYPDLNGLGLYNLKMEEVEKIFSGKIFNNEVFSKKSKRFDEK